LEKIVKFEEVWKVVDSSLILFHHNLQVFPLFHHKLLIHHQHLIQQSKPTNTPITNRTTVPPKPQKPPVIAMCQSISIQLFFSKIAAIIDFTRIYDSLSD
jgi:hypothetical protein